MKNYQNVRILHDSCPKKIIKIPEFLWYLPEKCPNLNGILHNNCPKKIFFPIFFCCGGGDVPPAPSYGIVFTLKEVRKSMSWYRSNWTHDRRKLMKMLQERIWHRTVIDTRWHNRIFSLWKQMEICKWDVKEVKDGDDREGPITWLGTLCISDLQEPGTRLHLPGYLSTFKWFMEKRQSNDTYTPNYRIFLDPETGPQEPPTLFLLLVLLVLVLLLSDLRSAKAFLIS